jgi:lipoate-protein ligase A
LIFTPNAKSELNCISALSLPTPWRLQVDGPLPGTRNMKIDEALLRSQQDPFALPVLRLFQWKRPTVSYGRLQPPPPARVESVCRPTGGGWVHHGTDLSLSLAWRRHDPRFPPCLKTIYRTIHETVQNALSNKKIETELCLSPGTSTGSCFQNPVENDLLWQGKKILGGALRVTFWGRLYQGNLLWEEMGLRLEETVPCLIEAFTKTFFRYPAGN